MLGRRLIDKGSGEEKDRGRAEVFSDGGQEGWLVQVKEVVEVGG